MKLKNKKTGEIRELPDGFFCGDNLKKICEEWEDYEEDELLYVVSAEHRSGYQCVLKEVYPEICEVAKELGIGFETEKECQKAVEKLKAWKRLKDKGFRFIDHIDRDAGQGMTRYEWDGYVNGEDLDLLFGDEE